MQRSPWQHIKRYINDKITNISAIALIVSGVFILLACLSYNSADPSLNTSTDSTSTRNTFGNLGSYIADFLLQSFGVGSLLICITLIIWGIKILINKFSVKRLYKILSFIGALICLCGFCAIFNNFKFLGATIGFGGLIGVAIYNWLYDTITPVLYQFSSLIGFMFLYNYAVGFNWGDTKLFLQRSWYYITIPFIYILGKVRGEDIEIKTPPLSSTKALADEQKQEPTIGDFANKIQVTKEATAKTAKQANLGLAHVVDDFEFPAVDLMQKAPPRVDNKEFSETALAQNARVLESVLKDFGVKGEITHIRPGPVVTLYELEPAPGTKSSRVIGLSDDIARSMSAVSCRIANMPGKNALGIELPNSKRVTVFMRELMESEQYINNSNKLPLALGKDIGGMPVIADLAKMPHLLVAGTTGAGKSVAINTMILSLIYHLPPSKCKFIMVDPKILELSVYEGIPHLMAPVVTEPAKAVVALKWLCKEMDNRYRLMSNIGVRNVEGYNQRIEQAIASGEELTRTVQTGFDQETGKPVMETVPLEMETLPFIVVIIDEMADLMLTAGKEIEASVQRLAQKARAAGIHVIMATQRPSVDVITGVIKANFPTRISFQVTAKVDSRTILGEMGAEQLLGMGDMLFMGGSAGGRIQRVHGPFVTDGEVEKIVNHLKAQGEPDYKYNITAGAEGEEGSSSSDGSYTDVSIDGSSDNLYDQAVAIVIQDKKVSTSYIQRRLRIGYNKAANLIERMEEEGVVSEAGAGGKREILVGNNND